MVRLTCKACKPYCQPSAGLTCQALLASWGRVIGLMARGGKASASRKVDLTPDGAAWYSMVAINTGEQPMPSKLRKALKIKRKHMQAIPNKVYKAALKNAFASLPKRHRPKVETKA